MTDDLLAFRYQLVRVLGQGAMGVVWLAQDTVLDRPIAIKELRPAPGVDASEATERFLVEARAAARLSHPNIVGIHDVFVDGERVLIAMELVEGPTLEEVLRSSGAQTPEVVRAIMAQVAQALAVAHVAGVIHRDLKPDNIFWTPDGRAVVTDFGLARIGAGRGTVEGTIMGTPGYMAPEQVRGTPTGPQSDVFAWGAVAYTLLTGQGPFGEPSITDPTALAYRIVHEQAPPLSIPDDPALAELITRCMSKEQERRPADGGELTGALMGPAHPLIPRLAPHSLEQADTDQGEVWIAGPGQAGRRSWAFVAAMTTAATLGGAIGIALTASGNSDSSGSLNTDGGHPSIPTTAVVLPTTRATVAPTTAPSTPKTTLAPTSTGDSVRQFFDSGYTYSDAVLLAAVWNLSEPYAGKIRGGMLIHESRRSEVDSALANKGYSPTTRAQVAYIQSDYEYADAVRVAGAYSLQDEWIGKLYIGFAVLNGWDLSGVLGR